ncbi:MAG: S-adenosylmethionine:tRNA ribosyltransferase-isomerase, partial [Deltaproteobacteria bacterium]|nr:S-adenosylmethionine:tRNA ribosyltransferase-isomerase [Deltaproteobacteria bacterium]
MRIGDFTYELPPDRIAQFPVEPRDASRLLVVRPAGAFEDTGFRDLPRLLEPGDLLVVNDTRVLPARLLGRKPTGGRVEVLLLTRLAPGEWEALVRASKPVRAGMRIAVADGGVRVLEPLGDGRYRVRIEAPEGVETWLERVGRMPLPPYIRREAPDGRDRSWYQTLFA